jgi:RNA polymerase sigma-B factor
MWNTEGKCPRRRPTSGFPGDIAESLFTQFAETRDNKTRNRLVVLYQDIVRSLAGRYVHSGEPMEDLVQVGTIGLINAIDRFDPSHGAQFTRYATPTIVGEIKRHFRDKSWRIKVSRRLQELNHAVNKAAESLTQDLGRPPTIQELARAVDASEQETSQALELRGAHDMLSLEDIVTEDGEASATNLCEFLGNSDDSLENMVAYDDLNKAIECLEKREQLVIYYRFFEEMLQKEVAKKLDISQMHVSRLEQKALAHLKELLSN